MKSIIALLTIFYSQLLFAKAELNYDMSSQQEAAVNISIELNASHNTNTGLGPGIRPKVSYLINNIVGLNFIGAFFKSDFDSWSGAGVGLDIHYIKGQKWSSSIGLESLRYHIINHQSDFVRYKDFIGGSLGIRRVTGKSSFIELIARYTYHDIESESPEALTSLGSSIGYSF